MALVYDESVRSSFRGGKPISQWSREAVMGAWQQHLENRAYLLFMAREGTFSEKTQAAKELEICRQKLAFWERHPEFDRTAAAAAQRELGAKWAGPARRRR
jgi:phage tail sheath gpL-like